MNQKSHDDKDHLNCSLCEQVQLTLIELESHYLGVHGIEGPPAEIEDTTARTSLEGGQEDNFIKLDNDPWWMGYSEISSASIESTSCPITRTEGSTENSISSQAPTECLSIDVVFQGKPPKPPVDLIELSSDSDTAPSSKEYRQPTESEIPSFASVAGENDTTKNATKWRCEYCQESEFSQGTLERHQLSVHGQVGSGIPEGPKSTIQELTDMVSSTKRYADMMALTDKLDKIKSQKFPPQKPPRKTLVPQNSIRSSQTPSTVLSPPESSPMTRALARLRVKKALFHDPKESASLTDPPSTVSNPPNSEKARRPLKKFLQVSLRRLSEEEIWILGGPQVLKPSGPLPFPEDSQLLTAHEQENKKLFHFYATLLEKKAILNVEESKRHIIFRNMRQNLLNRVDSRVFEFY